MPRSGWLAVGAVGSSLLAAPGNDRWAIVAGLLAMAVVIAAWSLLAIPPGGIRGSHGRGLLRAARVAGLVAIGVLLVAGRTLAWPLPAGSSVGTVPSGEGPWTGTILSISAPRAGQQPVVAQLDPPVAIKIAGTLPVSPVVVPGDRVMLTGSLRAPPSDDGYGAYLARIGVSAVIRVTTASLEGPSGGLGRRLEGLRRGADQAIRLAVPEPEAGLASGVLIGLRDRVDRDLSGAFTTVGATHVVAISGWNIAIVASALAALAGRLARRRRAALTALAIIVYVAFVGPTPSVVRAAGMAGVVMLARELGRPSHAAAAIGWAVAALLTVDPKLVQDVGFQLSALATVGLIAWGTPFSERLAGPNAGRVRGWLAESLGVSLAAQLATLPIVVLSFGRLSIVSPVVNLGVVPLVAPAMAGGVVAMAGGLLVLAGLPPLIATIAGLPGWLLFSLMVGIVRAGAGLPFASVSLEAPWDAIVAGLAAAAIAGGTAWSRRRVVPPADRAGRAGPAGAAARATRRRPSGSPRRTRQGRLLAGALIASVISLSIVAIHAPDGVPRVTVLDVGQGDAILVEGGRGGRLLVDGGPDPGRLLIALDERLPPWDRRIDVVVVSHPHADHVAGLVALVDRYAVGRVFESGLVGLSPDYAALRASLIVRHVSRATLATGDRLAIDEFRFRVLWPDPGTVPARPPDSGAEINNFSIVLLGDVGRHRLLLTGDIEEGVDPVLLGRDLPAVDLLKVSHHGSRTASTAALLGALDPSVAVISAGAQNTYGHPAPATVARLEEAGARVFRTDTSGSVTVDLGPGPLRVRTTGPRVTAVEHDPGLAPLPVPPRAPMSGRPAWAWTPPSAASVRLGYDAVRDPPALAPAGMRLSTAVPTRPNRQFARHRPRSGRRSWLNHDDPRRTGLLLGRRQLCPGRGRGRVAARSIALPRGRPRALAHPGRRGRRDTTTG